MSRVSILVATITSAAPMALKIEPSLILRADPTNRAPANSAVPLISAKNKPLSETRKGHVFPRYLMTLSRLPSIIFNVLGVRDHHSLSSESVLNSRGVSVPNARRVREAILEHDFDFKLIAIEYSISILS